MAGAFALAGCGSSHACGDGTPEGQQLCLDQAVCGNGVKEGSEACDDGNQTPGDGCENDCTVSTGPTQECGNGIKEGTEACDDGNAVNGDGCENDCTIPGCGNGVKDSGEACDDGNKTQGDACENDCTLPACGNGIQEGTEACDDGNAVNGDACENDCTLPACGNGIKEGAEGCDDGNTSDGDTCASNCTLPGCGNGIKEGTEACDDGNTANGDTCEADCTVAVCGNGIKDANESCDDGNTTEGDACENDCTPTSAVTVTCPGYDPTPPASGTCTVTAGDSGRLLTGIVLTPGKIIEGGQVLYDATGQISCVGCGCDTAPGGNTATQVVCPQGVISPGLINLHDHITYQDHPYVSGTDERYEHRNDWRRGLNGHTEISNNGSKNGYDVIQWAELRQVMAGTTSIAGAGGAPGLLRNLDVKTTAWQEGLNVPYSDSDTFPLGDTSGEELSSGCDYPSVPYDSGIGAYLPHIAEGIGAEARNEFLCEDGLQSGPSSVDVITPNTGIIHGVGVLATDVGRVATSGASLIWSPRSNVALYGDTAPISEYYHQGVQVALGTDWLQSGSMSLGRELKCAEGLNQGYFQSVLPDRYLWKMVTSNPAKVDHAESKIGSIEPGKLADLAIFSAASLPVGADIYQAVISSQPQDVVLTVRGGKVLYGDTGLVTALSADPCEAIPGDVCGTQKSACLAETGTTYGALSTTSYNATAYPLFFCGTPTDEPTCTPSRSSTWVKKGSTAYDGTAAAGTDSDGDGIPDADDNCPGSFNPIRPLDHGRQADNDGDGVGDVCDVCPLDATASASGSVCQPLDPNDLDGDGLVDVNDNCPSYPNADQADADNDQIGDVCDVCPVANPGYSACPVTVQDLKTPDAAGQYPYLGVKVMLSNVLVTAVLPAGFNVQSDGASADYAGIYVYTSGAPTYSDGTTPVAAGDRLDIASTYMKDFYGQKELNGSTGVTWISSGNALPSPTVVSSADIADTGIRAQALEATLVTVENVTVTDVAPAPGGGDHSAPYEFVIDNGPRVDDELYAISPAPLLNEVFTSITGVLDFTHDHYRIEPRDAADVVWGPATIASFGPQPTYTRVGDPEGPTFPQPLTLSLLRAQTTDTTVTVTPSSGDLAVANGGTVIIPAGALSAEVDVTGLNPNTVTLTATLGSATATADVEVLPVGNTANLAGLTSASATVPPGEAQTFTVTLDAPPAADTTVSLSINPASGFGTLPATVTVPRNQTTATFDVTLDAAATGTATVSATLGAVTKTADVTAYAGPPKLVINEVDYDQEISGDTAEFVEILNAGSTPVDLTNVALVLINGSTSSLKEYKRFALSGASGGATLAAGAYLVVGTTDVVTGPAAGCSHIDSGGGNLIQNGSPDGVALFDTSTHELIDSLAYEGGFIGSIDEGTTGTYPYSFNLLEGSADTASLADSGSSPGTLSRLPNGADTNQNASDFRFTATITPCAANQ